MNFDILKDKDKEVYKALIKEKRKARKLFGTNS